MSKRYRILKIQKGNVIKFKAQIKSIFFWKDLERTFTNDIHQSKVYPGEVDTLMEADSLIISYKAKHEGVNSSVVVKEYGEHE